MMRVRFPSAAFLQRERLFVSVASAREDVRPLQTRERPRRICLAAEARGQRDNYCRPCRTTYKHEHYSANKQRYIDNARRRRQRIVAERTAALVSFLHRHPCVDCGETDPLVLEFDHLEDKEFNIGQGLRDRAWREVLAEMKKCDVVCANCHRRRTNRRGGFIRTLVIADPANDGQS
jgi:ribosomal 50S subunit-associated protein YjgA (DUF615 family)